MLHITPLPAFEDNYIWLLHDDRQAIAVDPGDARPVIEHLENTGLVLTAVLVTHHHHDHTGGIATLHSRFAMPVYGPPGEDIPCLSHAVTEATPLRFQAPAVELAVLDIPGHTRGHVAYYGANALFCGDTLFSCGCGRIFEGTPGELYASLGKLAALPAETWVFCAHEYTLQNLRFARLVEPDNPALARREREAHALRQRGLPTLPSTLGEELATNPFLRTVEAGVRRAAEGWAGKPLVTPLEVFAALRAWRDGFRA